LTLSVMTRMREKRRTASGVDEERRVYTSGYKIPQRTRGLTLAPVGRLRHCGGAPGVYLAKK
jgi:hypothetical protein